MLDVLQHNVHDFLAYLICSLHRFCFRIYDKIAKIRMFGAACIDFSYAASGRTNGCVLITKNAWDISPGILLCEEAGCIVTDLEGNGHTLDSEGVIIASTPQIHTLLTAAFSKK